MSTKKGSSLIDKGLEKKRREIFEKKMQKIHEGQYDPLPMYGKSVYLFSADSKIRKTLRNIILHPYFVSLTYSFVCLSSILVTFDRPNVEIFEMKVILTTRRFLLVFFWAEVLIKTIVFGFIFEKNAYCKSY